MQWEEDRLLALWSICRVQRWHGKLKSDSYIQDAGWPQKLTTHVLPICTDGVLSHQSSVIMNTSWPWVIMSTHVECQCLTAGWWDSMKLMMMQSTGWKTQR